MTKLILADNSQEMGANRPRADYTFFSSPGEHFEISAATIHSSRTMQTLLSTYLRDQEFQKPTKHFSVNIYRDFIPEELASDNKQTFLPEGSVSNMLRFLNGNDKRLLMEVNRNLRGSILNQPARTIRIPDDATATSVRKMLPTLKRFSTI